MQFQTCKISINDLEIMAQNVSLTESNSRAPVFHLGKINNPNHTTSGPITNSLKVDYFMEVHNEPNYYIVSGLKSYQSSPAGATISFAGLNFVGYLNNYSFRIGLNDVITATAEYLVFSALEGDLATQGTGDYQLYNLGEGSGLGHSWTSAIVAGNSTGRIIEMDYRFSPKWKPLYKIGSTSPYSVKYLSSEETINLLSEYNPHVKYSGQKLTGFDTSLLQLRLKPISGLSNSTYIYFDVGNSEIIQSTYDISNNLVTNQLSAINHY